MSDFFYLYDETVEAKTRFVSFMGSKQRFDLAILQTDRYYGKIIVLDTQSHRFAIIGSDDLNEPGYLEHIYNLDEEDAEDLRTFLQKITPV
ncbi:DUF3055 domain-containing protein [Calidifontibacillus oryziterrae]|uniref:DUF3055 domain-containing protein n=1 Tax=Calidifontibacillus oryziterrae TaxID=1191699 RepID=UPI000477DCC6|nr:DUF3055 domain-containing protein [Calidifontibacillus oryziterrae]